MRLFDISLFLKRFPIKRAKEELLEISEIKEADYEAFLNLKKAEIVNYHLKNNSFYRNNVKDGFSTWESLPILKKVDYQIPLKERLSKGFSEKSRNMLKKRDVQINHCKPCFQIQQGFPNNQKTCKNERCLKQPVF